MPIYNTKTAAIALGVTPKWLDNLLSHNDIPTLHGELQGISRRLSLPAVMTIAVARELIQVLQLPAPTALRLADQLLTNDDGNVAVSPDLRFTLQRDRFRSSLTEALDRAVEVAPTPRRGRPRKR